MKNLSNYIVGFTLFVISLYFITLFLPSKINISHKEFVFGETKEVYSLFNQLENWEKWCVWNNQPNTIDIRYDKNTLGEGASFTWQYKTAKQSKGIIQITESSPYHEIDFYIKTDLVDTVYSNIRFDEASNGVFVEWNISLELEDSGSRLMGYLMKRWLIRDVKKSLRSINLYLISENKHIGWIGDKLDIIEPKDNIELYLIDTVQHENLDSILLVKFTELEKMQLSYFNNSRPILYYRVLDKINSNTSIIHFGTHVIDTTTIPKNLPIKKSKFSYANFRYFGSEIGYKYAIKSALKKARKDGIVLDPNPFIVYFKFPVNLSDLDTNSTALSFIIR